MRGFLFAVVGYCAVSMALVAVLFGDIAALLATAAVATGDFARMLGFSALWALPVIAVLPITIGRDAFRRRLAATTYAFLGCILLPVAFSFTKSSIPAIVPFYADPALAGFDRWLHGGTDPWTLSHGLAGNWPMAPLLDLYLYVWTIPATALPVLIALTDPDPVRSRRFVQLYLFVWLGLGSVGAIAFSSVGPVYYDALVGGDRFAAVTASRR